MFIFAFIAIILVISIAITLLILKAKDAYPGPFHDALQSSNPFSNSDNTNTVTGGDTDAPTPFPNAPTGLQAAFQELATAVNAAVTSQPTPSEPTEIDTSPPEPEKPKEDEEPTDRFDLIDMED